MIWMIVAFLFGNQTISSIWYFIRFSYALFSFNIDQRRRARRTINVESHLQTLLISFFHMNSFFLHSLYIRYSYWIFFSILLHKAFWFLWALKQQDLVSFNLSIVSFFLNSHYVFYLVSVPLLFEFLYFVSYTKYFDSSKYEVFLTSICFMIFFRISFY